MLTKYTALFIGIFLLTSGFIVTHSKRTKPPLKKIPVVEIYDLNNRHTTLPNVSKGKVTIIDCWFIPCPPCFREMELMHELYYKYNNSKDVQVISICRSDTAVFRKFIQHDPHLATFTSWFHDYSKQKKYALPTYFIPHCNERIYTGDTKYPSKNPDDETKCPDMLFHFRGYPTVIIADRNGKIVYQKTGYTSEQKNFYKQEINKAIQKALAAK
ncbi:TlpA family protein disulfide reductase [Mucilaginibacter sp. KACC 22063]|uniref:TlpA family protein disulfide reductase n=1 Tax=Mucilaginibacter sp. KACC 22063 TaxID=3025666 RepID=UPI002365C958|nr:thioredoxin-like domain-containing protein [Mucilaginibacter sp. KACC 22063]WDF56567.1 redoxin family protein [Mucilaginibacter sp. KACC 22063]